MRIGAFTVATLLLIPVAILSAGEPETPKARSAIVVFHLHSVSADQAAKTLDAEFLKSGADKHVRSAAIPKSPITIIPDAATNTLLVIAPHQTVRRIGKELQSIEFQHARSAADPLGICCLVTFPIVKLLDVSSSIKHAMRERQAARLSEAETEILEALNKLTSWDYRQKPLIAVLRELALKNDLNVVLDHVGLREVGLTGDSPVTHRVKSIPLRKALDGLLSPLGMTFDIEDEVLKITSRKQLHRRPHLVVYPVRDLVVTAKDGKAVIDFESVVRRIKAKSPASGVLRIEKKLCLAVTAKQAGHRKIVKLLRAIRAERAEEYDLPAR